MKKMPCLFQRDFSDKRHPMILEAVTPGCEWVLNGEGVATRKWDGTACLVRDGKLYKRYDAKNGKPTPPGFEPADDPDPVTGHWPGWLPVDLINPDSADVWHALAWWQHHGVEPFNLKDGSYELIGPKINSNAEQRVEHYFVAHGKETFADVPRDLAGIRAWLEQHHVEGIVFWRDPTDPNCDKCKIRRADFGFPWGKAR